MTGTQTIKKKTPSEKVAPEKNAWNQNIGSKKVKKNGGILEKWHGPKKRETKNSKWKIGTFKKKGPEKKSEAKKVQKKTGILRKWLGTKKRKAKNSNWKTGT